LDGLFIHMGIHMNVCVCVCVCACACVPVRAYAYMSECGYFYYLELCLFALYDIDMVYGCACVGVEKLGFVSSVILDGYIYWNGY